MERVFYDFSSDTFQQYTLEQKIIKLGLSQERVDELSITVVKSIGNINKSNFHMVEEIIDADKVVGLARENSISNITWLDILDDSFCHKNSNFIEYDEKNFDSVLLSETRDGLPVVVEYNSGYYIFSNGLHRLSMTKCIGGKKAKVFVYR